MARIAIMALEGLEQEVETNVESDEVNQARVEEIEASPEQEIQAMESAEAEAVEVSDAIDDSADTAAALGDVSDSMAETLPEGGMDERSAEVVRVAVEHMMKRIGFPVSKASFSMEGFADKTTRVQATKIAMETMAEAGKKIWDTIVAAIKKVIESVKTFFAHLFNAAKKNKARAEKLLAASKAAKDVKAKKIKGNSALVFNGAFIKPSELASALESNHKALDTGLLAALGSASKLKDLSRKCAELAKKLGGEVTEESIKSEFTQAGDYIITGWGKATTVDDKVIVVSNDKFIGDKVYKMTLRGKFYLPDSYGFEAANDKANKAEGEVDSLSAEQAGSVAEKIIKIMDDFLLYEKQVKEINDASFGFIEISKGVFNGAKEAGTNGVKDSYALMTATNGLIRMVSVTLTKVRSYEMGVAGAALSYAAGSLTGAGKVEEAAAK